MVLLSVVVFCILGVQALFPPQDIHYRKVLFLGVVCILFVFAGFRPIGSDYDSLAYVDIFENVSIDNVFIEPTFRLIAGGIKALGGDSIRVLLLVYALVGVSCKLFAIKKLTPLWFASAFFYFCFYFLVHEFTQIRAGVSAGIFLLSLPSLWSRNLKKYLLYCLTAFLFHYSALIMLPLWFLPLVMNKRWFLLGIIPLAYLLYFLNIRILLLIPIEPIRIKLESYQALQEAGNTMFANVNVFKPFIIAKVALYFLFYKYRHYLTQQNTYFPLFLVLFGLSISTYILFFFLPALATRASEFIGVVEIIIVPFVIYLCKPKFGGRLAIFALGCLFYFSLVFLSSYIH